MNLDELHGLPIGQKLDLVERLWDDIGASSEPLPLPEWVKEETSRRLIEMKANPSANLTEEEVWRRVDASRG